MEKQKILKTMEKIDNLYFSLIENRKTKLGKIVAMPFVFSMILATTIVEELAIYILGD